MLNVCKGGIFCSIFFLNYVILFFIIHYIFGQKKVSVVLKSLCIAFFLFFRFSVLINDNEKLQALFPAEVKNLVIRNGSLNFHFNRKLCLHVIKAFEKNVTMMSKNYKNDISNRTNGDQAPCKSLLFLTI